MSNVTYQHCPLDQSSEVELYLSTTDYSITGEPFEIYRSKKSGFLFTQNVPDETSIGPYYASEKYISHSNTDKGLVNKLYHFARSYMLGRKRSIIQQQVQQKGKLLDIGSGTGYFPDHMQQHGWEVLGIEPGEDARAFAIKSFGLDIRASQELFSLPEQEYDVITMWHVLEHIHRLHDYMETCFKVLKDDGLLVIALPNHKSYDARHYGRYWAGYDVPRHLWHFAPDTLGQLAQQHNFDVVAHKPMPLDAFYVSLLSEQYKKKALAFFLGMYHGGISWLKSLGDAKKCSSVIYLLRKKS